MLRFLKGFPWTIFQLSSEMSSPNVARVSSSPVHGHPNQSETEPNVPHAGSSIPLARAGSGLSVDSEQIETEATTNQVTSVDNREEVTQTQNENQENNRSAPVPLARRRRTHLRRRTAPLLVVQDVPPNPPPPQQQQQNEQGQGEQNNNRPAVPAVVIQPVNHAVQNQHELFNEGELRVIKDVVDYLIVPISKSAINLMIIAWYLIYLPNIHSFVKDMVPRISPTVTDVFTCFIIAGLAGKSVMDVVKRPDIRVFGPFNAFDIRIAQLMAVATICVLLDTVMNPIGFGFGILHFNIQDPTKFHLQVEELRKMGLSDMLQSLSLWFHVNVHFFLVSFAILFAIDIAAMFHRMTRRNAAMAEIFSYEFYAYLYPVGYITSTLFILNCVAALLPTPYQSFWFLWVPLNILAFTWIGIILVGVFSYPEIPLRRPMGLPGYMFMEQVTLTQIGIGGSLHGLLTLFRGLYFQLLPGTKQEALEGPGIVTGSSEYFSQILGENPKTESSDYPFPFSYDLVHGIYFIVFLIRYVKLRISYDAIMDRIERDLDARNFMD